MAPQIISRAEWGAEYGRGDRTNGAKLHLIAHHDGNDRLTSTSTLAAKKSLIRLLEHYHVHGDAKSGYQGLTGAKPRIAYTWLLDPFDGIIFEGTGWGYIGAHTKGLNSSGYAVCVPVNGAKTKLSPAAVAAFQWLRKEGMRLGHLATNHIVSGHQDHGKPSCPGALVYDQLVRASDDLAPAPTVREVVSAHPTLRVGKGADPKRAAEVAAVKVLQRRLFEMQELEQRHITGFFGPLTDAAVRRIQRKYRLTADGIVGPQTYKVLSL